MPTPATSIVRVCLLVLGGGFAAQHNRVPLSPDLCYGLFVAAVLLFAFRRVRGFAGLLLGFSWFMLSGIQIVDSRLDAKFAGDSLLADVRIADFPKASGRSVAFLIEPVDDVRLPNRSRVTWFDPPKSLAFGDVWQLELRLRRPRGSSNPGGFSTENWMFRERLHAAGYVVPGKRNRRIAQHRLSAVESMRRDFVRQAEDSGGDAAPVIAAIGVGARHLIGRAQWERYARTGSSHLMAISGLHIGLAAAASFATMASLFGILRLRGNYLRCASLAALAAACAYAAVSGFAVPAQRATLMLGLLTVAFVSRRPPDSTRIVALAALALFLIDPVSSMAPGFSLSFAAVITLLWYARQRSRRSLGGRVLQFIPVQIQLLFALAPITVITFQRIALAAPLVNLVAVPVFSLITVPATLTSMVIAPVSSGVGHLFLGIAAASVMGVERLVGFFAERAFADTRIAGVSGLDSGVWLIVFLPALWALLPRGWPGRSMAVLGLVALLLHAPAAPPKGCFDTHVLDVGQGLAVVVHSNAHSLVFDTGASFRGGGTVAEHVVLPFLRHQAIGTIDWLIVSHADNDHAGGVAAVANGLPTGHIYSGESLPGFGRPTSACVAGEHWRADGVDYRFLHPGAQDRRGGNDSSCVLIVSAGDKRLLLTGDIEKRGEQRVLQRFDDQSATTVLIPHHGSLTSSTPAFVRRTGPDLAIASVGHGNRWGFPNDAVTARWESVGARVLDTASDGAISFRTCADGTESGLRRERLRRRRFWHDP